MDIIGHHLLRSKLKFPAKAWVSAVPGDPVGGLCRTERTKSDNNISRIFLALLSNILFSFCDS